MAIWKLTIEDDEGQKTVVPLVRDDYTVGRNEGHAIRLTERNVSRSHARFRKNADTFILEDLGSYNGVFVNGHRVSQPHTLQSGDLVLLGDYRMEVHDEEAPARIPGPVAATLPFAPKPAAPPPPPTSAPPSVRPLPADLPPRLILVSGETAGKEFPLEKDKIKVGRGEEVDVQVNHSSVSRHHCSLIIQSDGRWEVSDESSANGVRVNGTDRRKMLLTTGDVIELGDVQLKFIAAGQAFIFDASAVEIPRPRRRSTVTTWAILVPLILAAAAGGVVLARQGKDEPVVGSKTSSDPDDEPLKKAVLLMKDGDLSAAHEKISALAKDSPLRGDARAREIEDLWANGEIERLIKEPDEEKKRAGIKLISASGANETIKKKAAGLLEKAKEPELIPEPLPSATVDLSPSASATGSTDIGPAPTARPKPLATGPLPVPTAKPTAAPPTTSKPFVPPTTPTAKPTAAAPATGCAAYAGDYAAAMRANAHDCVRGMLYPRAKSGSITPGEARYLKGACASLGDAECQKVAASKM